MYSRRAYIPMRIQTEIRLAYGYEPGHRRFEKKRVISCSDGVEKRQNVIKKTDYNFDIINIEGNNRKKRVKHIVRHICLRSAIKRVTLGLAFLLQSMATWIYFPTTISSIRSSGIVLLSSSVEGY